MFYTSPCYDGYKYSGAMKDYAIKRGVEYLNLYEHMDEMKMSGETDFQDSIHLNKSGAEKVARFLAEYSISYVR